PEHDPAVEHRVVHGDEVRRAVAVDRRDVQLVRAGEEGADLLVGHPDALPLVHAKRVEQVPPYSARVSDVPSATATRVAFPAGYRAASRTAARAAAGEGWARARAASRSQSARVCAASSARTSASAAGAM